MDALKIFKALASEGDFPTEAIRAAQRDREAMIPLFLAHIEAFTASGGEPSEFSPSLFFAFHLLGEWRETSAYRPLARMLHLPEDTLEDVLGDANTETAHRVMAAVFDGDPDPLYEIIRDPNADQYVRSGMFETITMLTLKGELPRADVKALLRACGSELQPQQDNFVWCGWADAVAALGFADLTPLVKEAYARGSIDETWRDFEGFERNLQRADAHPDEEPLSHGVELRPFGDTVDELSHWSSWSDQEERSDGWEDEWRPSSSWFEPERNPLRHVGRNDPCPCGSGKKFKKCCLNADGVEPASVIKVS
jgi:hypothetical protein